jgi:hypothetical protein
MLIQTANAMVNQKHVALIYEHYSVCDEINNRNPEHARMRAVLHVNHMALNTEEHVKKFYDAAESVEWAHSDAENIEGWGVRDMKGITILRGDINNNEMQIR